MNIGVSQKGAIILGDLVCCDGFLKDRPFRVQTHVHHDHLRGISSSFGNQNGVVMTEPTRDLLSVILNNPAIFHRQNVLIMRNSSIERFNGFKIELINNGHMLGSVQVAVHYDNGKHLGYSGDFSWPLDDVIKVDELVVDSTYGFSDSVHDFDRDQVNRQLLETISEKLPLGPIIVKASRGTMHNAMHTVQESIKAPIIVSSKQMEEIQIYNKWGYGFENIYKSNSEEGRKILNSDHYIRFLGTGDKPIIEDYPNSTLITLKALYGRSNEPITRHLGVREDFHIAYSDHADFNGTIDYIKATGAKFVLTDPSRSGMERATELAKKIRSILNIKAKPAENIPSQLWGE